MGRSAALAYGLEAEDSAWRPLCCLLEGVAAHLAGDPIDGRAQARGGRPPRERLGPERADPVPGAARGHGRRAGRLAGRRRLRPARDGADAALRPRRLRELGAGLRRLGRRGAHRGQIEEARPTRASRERLLATLTDFMPWYEAEARVALSWAALRLGDVADARELLAEAARSARRVPDAPVLARRGSRPGTSRSPQAAAAGTSGRGGAHPGRAAGPRVPAHPPVLPGDRQPVQLSTNTIKTQAHAVYRKLDAASRSEAVARATTCGLLDP